MSMTREELQTAAQKVFGDGTLNPDREASWGHIAEQGWLMMGVPEDKGGLGFGREAQAVIHYELGKALVPGPIIAQLAAIDALVRADADDDLLESAMAGEKIGLSLELADGGDTYRAVADADEAAHIMIYDGASLALYDPASLTVTERATWDETRRLSDVTINGATPTVVLAQGEAAEKLTKGMKQQLALGFAGDSLGGASAILDLTIDYLKTRKQFDRPLAMFQALKHRVADMRTWLTAAEAFYWPRAAEPTATVTQLGAMKVHCAGVYRDIVEEAIQLHGGIGLTEEYYCHLFLKRAMLNCALGGTADLWEEANGRRVMQHAVA